MKKMYAALLAAAMMTAGAGWNVQAFTEHSDGGASAPYFHAQTSVKGSSGYFTNSIQTDGTVSSKYVSVKSNITAGDGHFQVHSDGSTDVRNLNVEEGITTNSLHAQGLRIGGIDVMAAIDEQGNEIDNVGAISAALAGLHPLDYDGTGSKFQISAAMGAYDGSQAMAIGGFYHFNEDVLLSLSGATSFDGDHKTAGNIGVTFRVGQGSSGKKVNSDDVLAQLEAMNEKIAALEAENQSLSEKVAALEAPATAAE